MSEKGLTIHDKPRYVWCHIDKIEETKKIMGKEEPVKIEIPCEFGPGWAKLYYKEE